MKKIIFSILFITLLFLIPISCVQADSYANTPIEISINNPLVKKGEEFELIIKNNETFNMGALNAKITFDTNNLEYLPGSEEGIAQVEKGSEWLSVLVNSNNSTLSAITSQKIESQQIICKIKLRAKKNLLLKNDSIKLEDLNIIDNSYENKTFPNTDLKILNPAQKNPNIVIIISILFILVLVLLISVLFIFQKKKTTKQS
ncbi:MAG: hypothetical protein J6K42_01200 [Clostridia bacterium]|nr:hypothetical protein [Clostridia bacterium]